MSQVRAPVATAATSFSDRLGPWFNGSSPISRKRYDFTPENAAIMEWMILKDQFFQLISHDSTKACCHDSGLHPKPLESPGHSCKPESAATMAPRSESSSHRNYARTTHAIQIVHWNHNTCINIHTARNSLTHCFLFASVWTQKNLHN